MSTRWPGTCGALLLFLSTGPTCGSEPSSVAAMNYDRRCTSVADCFPVYEGLVGCCGGSCPNTAIRQDALTKYMSDVDRVSAASCNGVRPPCGINPFCDRRPGRVACNRGICQLETASADAASDE